MSFCHRLESNQPHADFQSAALPTELQRRRDVFNNIENWILCQQQKPKKIKKNEFFCVLHKNKKKSFSC